MKLLLTILLVIPCAVFGQTYDLTDSVLKWTAEYKEQPKKWYSFSKNDIAVMSLEVGAGYFQGWREEILYHPHQLFERYPNLNRRFWDARWSWINGSAYKWDANHVFKGAVAHMHIAAVAVKFSNMKSYKKKDVWKKIVFDMIKYYASYQLGFAISYNLQHQNPLFKSQ